MKAAIVLQAGKAPVYGDFKEPVPVSGENRIAVTAAALSPVVKARTSGTHYSSSGDFPIGVGIDGVGRLDDGSRVHFFLPRAPYGSMAEKVNSAPARGRSDLALRLVYLFAESQCQRYSNCDSVCAGARHADLQIPDRSDSVY